MTIEIHQPELEALIQQRMESGRFATVEDALLEALKPSAESELAEETPRPQKKSFSQFMMESLIWKSGIEFERSKDLPRIIDL